MTIYTTPESFEDPTPSFGGQLGTALGGGISSGLQLLMESKMKRLAEKEKLAQLQSILGGRGAPSVAPPGAPGALSEITDEQILAVSATDPNLAKILQSQKESATKSLEKKEERAFRRNEKYLLDLDDQFKGLPKQKLAIKQMRDALESNDFSTYRNAFADYTGFDFLKSASAQTVNAAAKEFLISSLASITGRPNQFLEKQITKALISPQYSDAANELILEGIEGISKLKELEINAARDLEEKFTQQGKEIPRNFQRLVSNKIQKAADQFEKEYEKKAARLIPKPGKKEKAEKTEAAPRVRNPKTGEILEWTGSQWKKVLS